MARLGSTASLPRGKIRLGPAIGAVREPDDVGIAPGYGALGGVPRHPAIAQAVDHDRLIAVAAGQSRERGAQIGLGRRGELAVTGINQPDAARDIEPRPVAPDRARRQLAGRGARGITSTKIAVLSRHSAAASAAATTRAPASGPAPARGNRPYDIRRARAGPTARPAPHSRTRRESPTPARLALPGTGLLNAA